MSDLFGDLTPSARRVPESGIVKVFNHGRTREGLIPLWAGEGDTPTPPLIQRAAAEALADGQTFYTYQRGIPALREALAAYFTNLYGRPFSMDEFFVTPGGMGAIQLAVQMIVGEGDQVVVPTPAWPNFEGAITSRGGAVTHVPMRFGPDGWMLDLDELFDACISGRTRAIFINTPSNPTGWTASQQQLRDILSFARRRNIWIIADEIYGRFFYGTGGDGGDGGAVAADAALAPSFQTIREPGDRIVFVQTFSKNWAMTGWRMGWLQAPAELGQTIENLIQYNTSGVASFLQPAGVTALTEGSDIAREQIARARAGRDIVCRALEPVDGLSFAWPTGAFYLLFGIQGARNSLEAALKLVDEAAIGLAPGSAFGPGGEGFFRICYLRSPEQLAVAMERLTAWLKR